LKAFAHQSHPNRVYPFPDLNGLAIEENPSKLQIQDSTDSLIGFLIGPGSGVDQKRSQKRNKSRHRLLPRETTALISALPKQTRLITP
jgi:hypothetical protein